MVMQYLLLEVSLPFIKNLFFYKSLNNGNFRERNLYENQPAIECTQLDTAHHYKNHTSLNAISHVTPTPLSSHHTK